MDSIGIIKKSEDSEEKSKYVFYLSVVLIASAGVLGAALIGSATFTPNLPAHLSGLVTEDEYSDVELVFNQSDVETVNNRLDENREFGWCLSTERSSENRFSVNLTKGENMTRSSNGVSFSCSVWDTGRLHTHPGIWTLPSLSKFDREAFRRSNQRFHCVAAGYVNTLDGPIGLNCYQKSGRDIERIRVDAVTQ